MIIKNYGLALNYIDHDKLNASFHKVLPYVSGNEFLTLERYANRKLNIDILDINAMHKLDNAILNFKLHLIKKYINP